MSAGRTGGEHTALEIVQDELLVCIRGVGVQSSHLYICCTEGTDLVVHEGQERRYDDGDAVINNSW